MKKKIITKTLLFLAIVLFVSGFKGVFGESNTLVGVSTVVASLVLLEKNLTTKPLMSFLELLATNILIGVLAFISSHNMWYGLVIDFVTLASIGYIFSYSLSKRLIVPFGLQYLFILYSPIEYSELGTRLVSLATGAVVVMVMQFIANAKKEKNPETEESLLFTEGEDDHDDTSVTIFGKVYNVHPVRARYAVRVGILTAFSAFITTLLGLEQGKWIAFTVFSLTELYSEHCKVKSKERMQGTLIGSLIVMISFIFIKDIALRTFIILMAGYMNPFAENYRDATICVTVSSVASVALTNGTLITALERILYVAIGIIISLIANKYILKAPKKEAI